MTCGGAKNADTTNGISIVACHENLALIIASNAIVTSMVVRVRGGKRGDFFSLLLRLSTPSRLVSTLLKAITFISLRNWYQRVGLE